MSRSQEAYCGGLPHGLFVLYVVYNLQMTSFAITDDVNGTEWFNI